MKDALKKLIIKHGGTYNRYDNTEKELLQRLCDALDIPYDRYATPTTLLNTIVESGKAPEEPEFESIWESLIPNKLYRAPSIATYFASNNVDAYSYSRNTSTFPGLFHKNLETGEETYIYQELTDFKFFTDNIGTVYAYASVYGSYTYDTCILKLEGNTAIELLRKSFSRSFSIPTSKFETIYIYNSDMNIAFVLRDGYCLTLNSKVSNILEISSEECYMYYPSSGYTMYHIVGSTVTSITLPKNQAPSLHRGPDNKIYMTTSEYRSSNYYYYLYLLENGIPKQLHYFGKSAVQGTYLASDGVLYLVCSPLKIFKLVEDSVEQLYEDTVSFSSCVFFESSKGDLIIASSSYANQIMYIHNNIVSIINVSNGYWTKFYEATNGAIYIGNTHSSSTEVLLCISEGTSTIISSETLKAPTYFFEDNIGTLYTCSNSSSYPGIYLLNGSTITQVYDTGYGWQYFFTGIDNHLYVSAYYTRGLIELYGGTLTFHNYSIAAVSPQYTFVDSSNNMYITAGSNGSDVLILNSEGLQKIGSGFMRGGDWQELPEGGIFAYGVNGSSTVAFMYIYPNNTIYVETGTKICTRTSEGIPCIVSSSTPKYGEKVYLINNGTLHPYKYIGGNL